MARSTGDEMWASGVAWASISSPLVCPGRVVRPVPLSSPVLLDAPRIRPSHPRAQNQNPHGASSGPKPQARAWSLAGVPVLCPVPWCVQSLGMSSPLVRPVPLSTSSPLVRGNRCPRRAQTCSSSSSNNSSSSSSSSNSVGLKPTPHPGLPD